MATEARSASNVVAIRSGGGKSHPARLNLCVEVSAPELDLRAPGILEYFTAGEVAIVLDRLMPHGSLVQVQFNNAGFEGEVVYCEPKSGLYEVHVLITESDGLGMRRTVRFPVDLPAKVLTMKPGEDYEARIVDISEDGMGLELKTSPVVGETMAIESESSVAFGVIRHCRQLPDGRFRAGLEMLHVARKERDAAKQAMTGASRTFVGFWRKMRTRQD